MVSIPSAGEASVPGATTGSLSTSTAQPGKSAQLFETISQDSVQLSSAQTAAPRKTLGRRLLDKILNWTGIRQGMEQAAADMKNQPVLTEGASFPLKDTLLEGVRSPIDTAIGLHGAAATDPSLGEAYQRHLILKAPTIDKTINGPEYISADIPTKKKMIIEAGGGVGAGKGLQILASDVTLDAELKEIAEKFKSGGLPTRTLGEQQAFINELYGPNKYTVIKQLGVGTVGETVLAETTLDKTPVIIKMIKQGVTKEALEIEHRAGLELIRKHYSDPEIMRYQEKKMNNLYTQWVKELDFEAEAKGTRALARNAKRYRVAQALEVGYTQDATSGARKGASLVLEMAEGIPLETVSKMIETYRTKPYMEYLKQFSADIEKHPWLAHPGEWMHQVPKTYLEAMNEQTLLRMGNQIISHGDPHSGNVFFHYDTQAKKLIPTFIDTGLTVQRSREEVLKHVGLFVDTLTGNAKGLAKRLVNLAESLPEGVQRSKLIRNLTRELDRQLFKARINLNNAQYNDAILNAILERYRIILPATETGFFKAQMQTVMNYAELSKLVGQEGNSYLRDSLKDIMRSVGISLSERLEQTLSAILPGAKNILADTPQALRTMFQFFIRRV